MSKLLKKLTQFFSLNGSVSRDLESYIVSKNPQSITDVERLTRRYLSGGVCRRVA